MTEPKRKFAKMMGMTLKISGTLNAKQRRIFPFAQINKIGINSYQQVETEMELILEKKSKLSAINREAVARVYLMCNIKEEK